MLKGLRSLILAGLSAVFLWPAGDDPVAPFRGLALGESRQSRELEFRIGHARVSFTGRWSPLLQEGKVVGAFLDGKGTLEYRSEFEMEFTVAAKNLEEWTDIKPSRKEAELGMAIPFDRARLLLHGVALPAWPGDAATAVAGSLASHERPFRKVFGFDPAQEHALAADAESTKPWVLLELSQGEKAWLYRYDARNTLEETLDWNQADRSRFPVFKEWRQLIRVSRQTLGWDLKKGPPPPPFQVRKLDVDLRTPDNKHATLVVEETIHSNRDSLRLLKFQLFDENITYEGTWHLKVTRILDEQGRELAFDHARDTLVVALGARLPKGGALKLRFEYGGDFLYQPNGDNYWQLPVRGMWYPESPALNGESYQFHGLVRTKGDWISFMPGETVRRGKEGDWNVLETKTDQPISWPTILGGKYYLEEETKDGLTVRIATYAFKPGSGNRPIKEHAFNIVKFYKEILGPFPFKELTVVQVNQWGYGQAPPGMMYITNEAFNQAMDLGPFFRTGIRGRFAHEIAHQYWGTVVKMPSHEEQWITESFADYCAALYEGVFKGEYAFKTYVSKWENKAGEYAKYAPIPLANDLHLKGMEGFLARNHLLYSKGPILLRALHVELGDKDFITFLRSLQTNFRWKFMTTHQLFDFLKFMKKKDYGPFAERFYWGLGMPAIQ